MKRAEPRFPGHAQPKVPLWGYEDEADPRVMARKIDAAANCGLNHFIFDWYWYDDGPYLELFARRQRPGWTCLGNEMPTTEAA